jgi:hypothetical protein
MHPNLPRRVALSAAAFNILSDNLEAFGNVLSHGHREALHRALDTLAAVACGDRTGRFAIALDPGLGKSQAVVALAVAIHRLGMDDLSIAVACSQITELESLIDCLVANGVPLDRIGIIHSKGSACKYPSTRKDDDTKQFQFCSHVRVRDSMGYLPFMKFNGTPRPLLVWDESLFTSDVRSVDVGDLSMALTWVMEKWHGRDKYPSILRWSSALVSAIKSALETEQAVVLPELSPEERTYAVRHLPEHSAVGPLKWLFSVLDERLEVLKEARSGKAIVTYRPTLPAGLDRVVILDASYPIRYLVNIDQTIQPVPMPEGIKDYSALTVNHVHAPAGRESLERDFTGNRHYIAELVHLLQHRIPRDESVLVWTFKDRGEGRVEFSFTDRIKAALEEAGFKDDLTSGRICIQTWGKEVATSAFKHCTHVVMLGVMHKPPLAVACDLVGQRAMRVCEDGKAPAPFKPTAAYTVVHSEEVTAASRGEVLHSIYQALNRAACRTVVDGKAGQTTLWLPYPDFAIRDQLGAVLPGATWQRWETQYIEPGKHRGLDELMAEALAELEEQGEQAVSVRAFKARFPELAAAHQNTFTNSLTRVLRSSPLWERQGRSIVRIAGSSNA